MKFLNRFSRITTSGRTFIPQIDGLRFIAIMWVLAFHVQAIGLYHLGVPTREAEPNDLIYKFFEAGHFGVQLFFTISGFVLALPFAKEKLCGGSRVSLPSYYLRRVTRLEPPYVIHLIFVLALTWAVLRKQPAHADLYQNPAWLNQTLKHIIPSLFYSHGFVYGGYPYPNIVLWSLEVEVQFYVLAPFLSLLFLVSKKSLRRGLLALLMVVASLMNHFIPEEIISRVMLLGNLHFFLGGFLLADLYLTQSLSPATVANRESITWDALFVLALAGIFLVARVPALILLLPWFIFICCMAGFKGWVSSSLLKNRLIVTIGGMCYTIYMYHWLMISGVIRLTKGFQTHVIWWDLIVQFVLMSAVIIPICALVFALFERPFMQKDWPAKLWTVINRYISSTRDTVKTKPTT